MEALVLIFAELIIACMMPVVALAGAALAGLLELFLWILASIFGGIFQVWLETRRARSRTPATAKSRKPLIPRKLVHWTAGIFAALGLVGVVASFLFFQPIVRYVLDTAADKVGGDIQFESASGTLLAGDIELTNVHVVRDGETGLTLDVTLDRIQAEVDVWSLLSDVPVIDLAAVEGVTGYVSPPKRDKDKAKPKKERRAFRANEVDIKSVDLEIRPKGAEPYSLKIETAEVAPFRSGLALFDLLFRSNMRAELAGQELIVQTRRITDKGRETLWSFENVEAEQLKLLLPRAPLTWLSDGTLTARVEDRWSLSEDWVDMDWLIDFEDMVIVVPEEAKTTEKLLGGTLAKFVNSRGGTVEIRYQLDLDKDEIAALRAGDLEAFWDVVLEGFLSTKGKGLSIDTKSDEPEPKVEEDKPGAIDKLKGLFKRDSEE